MRTQRLHRIVLYTFCANKLFIAQGMPECSDCTCMLVCAFFCAQLHARPRVQQAPGIPCSLFSLGDEDQVNLGRYPRRENATAYSVVVTRQRVARMRAR